MSTVLPSPPENRDDITENISTFLNLRKNSYQLLANMVNPATNDNYQIYGQFDAEKITNANGKKRFLIKSVNLKWVDIISNHSTPCRVAQAKFVKKENKDLELQIFLKNVYEPHHGIDCTEVVNYKIKSGKHIYIKIIQEGEQAYTASQVGGYPCRCIC